MTTRIPTERQVYEIVDGVINELREFIPDLQKEPALRVRMIIEMTNVNGYIDITLTSALLEP